MFRHISLLMRCFMCCCHFILPPGRFCVDGRL